jgi:hypothetical protein
MGRLYTPTLLPLKYQSQDITLPEWITLFTVCLAPLLANLVAGAPRISTISKRHRPWHESICLYNPTSILWRYVAITDRKIRAKEWLKVDVAAANAIFWTDDGWDGSENMVVASLSHCSRLPERTRAEPLSGETLKTMIVTLQGLQTFYLLIGSFITNVDLNDAMGLDGIFNFLSVFGCLRLFAALWLTEDYQYIVRDDTQEPADTPALQFQNEAKGAIRPLIQGIIDDIVPGPRAIRDNYIADSWASISLRVTYLLLILGMWAIAFIRAFPWQESMIYAVTTYLVILFFLVFLTISILTFTWYFVRTGTRSTIMPCISRTWYKIYTVALFCFMIVMGVVAAIETRRTICGKYTSWDAAFESDAWICAKQPMKLYQVAWDSTHEVFAVAANMTKGSDNFTVLGFVGDCVGRADYSSTRRAAFLT